MFQFTKFRMKFTRARERRWKKERKKEQEDNKRKWKGFFRIYRKIPLIHRRSKSPFRNDNPETSSPRMTIGKQWIRLYFTKRCNFSKFILCWKWNNILLSIMCLQCILPKNDRITSIMGRFNIIVMLKYASSHLHLQKFYLLHHISIYSRICNE